MKLLSDFLPVLLFFIIFKLSGIYVATAVAIGASVVQVILNRVLYGQFDKLNLITLLIIVLLGGATLIFQDPLFIKWKPTGIYWVTACLFLGSQFFSKKTFIQRFMEGNITLSPPIWRKLNTAWALFFTLMGILNLLVAYHFDTNTWVNFKLFGGFGITLLFVLVQSIYLSKHIPESVQGPLTKHENLTGRR